MSFDPRSIAEAITYQLEAAWNAGDGRAYGVSFAEDAGYITVLGHLIQSRGAITDAHQSIFKTIYRNSVVRQKVIEARALTGDVIMAQVDIMLSVPSGHIAGDHNAIQTLVIVRQDEDWRVAHFQSTLVVAL